MSTYLVPKLLGSLLERKPVKYFCLVWQKMVDLQIQFLRHEIQYIDEIMYVLLDVRFRAISEVCSAVSLLCPNQVTHTGDFSAVFLHSRQIYRGSTVCKIMQANNVIIDQCCKCLG